MAIKAADTLKPNGSFYLAEAADISITVDGAETNLSTYVASLTASARAISKIEKTGTDAKGKVDTYTITFTDGTTSTFTVTNGSDGDTGLAALQPNTTWTGTYTTIGGTASADFAKFNRNPVVGDTFLNMDGASNMGTWQVTAISGTTATLKLLSYVACKGAKGDTGATGGKGDTGATGSAAHVTLTTSTDTDGYRHAYVKTWEGSDESAATTSPDLMASVNDVLAAVQEIMKTYTGETAATSSEEA